MSAVRGGFYAILDPEHLRVPPLEACAALLQGGASVIQLRAKATGAMSDSERVALARAMNDAATRAGVPLVINDRADIAHAAHAAGVHLGQDDLSPRDARELLGPDALIGLSTHSESQAREAQASGADLIGFGPVFDTQTKVDADPTVGLAKLRAVCALSSLPVVAIGGLNPARACEAYDAGARWVAAISAVIAHETTNAIESAARRMSPSSSGAPA